ncbi:hypothetical protein CEXT_106871 [Caerostris extrusa]|uniref:Uncharacterized protein n=1 Tax=Caerostris extrusa TaxID=172846 RepID=A0AAV4Y754_CAEEX|nr:hypothetical protein CEXT_106871 [Caerostris extrusa]
MPDLSPFHPVPKNHTDLKQMVLTSIIKKKKKKKKKKRIPLHSKPHITPNHHPDFYQGWISREQGEGKSPNNELLSFSVPDLLDRIRNGRRYLRPDVSLDVFQSDYKGDILGSSDVV